MAAAKGAKAASFDTDIGEIDVAIDNVSHDVADRPGAQIVGRRDHCEEIRPIGVE
jgi:hypothetical protein